MQLVAQFQLFIRKENLFSAKDTLLLAVSGGVDSVALCALCQQAGYDFEIAHCNFQLRGEESERDEQFVRALGRQYGKQVLVKRFDTQAYAAQHKVSMQVAARELRYAWFYSIVDNRKAGALGTVTAGEGITNGYKQPTLVVTAHHLDDNIETLLMNFFKGTGIAGLRGILPKQGQIVRPLLFAKKEAIQQFAKESELSWVEDSSNQQDKYTRNYFRQQLIPMVKKWYPEADSNLGHNLERFRDIEQLYRQSIELHKKKLLEYRENEVHIPVLKLKKAVPLYTVLYEIIKLYGFGPRQTDEVLALMESDTGRYTQSATHRIIRNRNWLIISPVQTTESANILIEETATVIAFEAGLLTLKKIKPSIPGHQSTPNTITLDAATVAFPLLLRKWKTGDYFYPLGMRKKKKLSRFFIDQKLSKTEKEKIWVLESDKKIIWVLGKRIDERCKISGGTKQVLQLQLEPKV